MQFLKVAHELITDTTITSNEFRIYAYLMMLYNEKSGCSFPSMETIAYKLGISKRTIVTTIKKLEELEYIKVDKQKAKIGNYNKYSEFKYLVPNKKKEVKVIKTKKKLVKSIQVDSNGNTPIDGQIHITEAIEEAEKVKILTSKERREQDKLDSNAVRIARSYTDIDNSKFAIDVISCLDAEIVRQACNSFKNKLELGKFKKNVATNLVKECIEMYCKNGVEIPRKAFNIYKKVDNLLIQPIEAKELRELKEPSIDYVERINRELGVAL